MTILDSSLERDLVQAASRGDVERVADLIDAGVNPSALPSGCSYPALHAAAARGHLSVVEILLARGCPVDLPDSIGATALALVVHTIADLPEVHDRVELSGVVRALLKAGASPRAGRSREDAPIVLARAYELTDLENMLLPYCGAPSA